MQRFSTLRLLQRTAISISIPRIQRFPTPLAIKRLSSSEPPNPTFQTFTPAEQLDKTLYDSYLKSPDNKDFFVASIKNYNIDYCENHFKEYVAILVLMEKLSLKNPASAFELSLVFGAQEAVYLYFKKIQKNRDNKDLDYDVAWFAIANLPVPRRTRWNFKLWQQLSIRHLPSKAFSVILKLAPEIDEYVQKNQEQLKVAINAKIKAQFEAKGPYEEKAYKSACKNAHQHILSQHTDISTLQEYALMATYKNANKNLAAAKLFFKFHQDEAAFEVYLSLVPKDDDKLIPNVSLDGANYGHPHYKIEKLSPFSPEAALLGFFSGCCQHLAGFGARAAKHGIENPYGGFYVIRRKKDGLIVAQCWAWRSKSTNNIVFDSIEAYEPYRYDEKQKMVCESFRLLAHELVRVHKVPRVLVGCGGGTPRDFGKPTKLIDKFYKHLPYTDASDQRLIAAKTPKGEI